MKNYIKTYEQFLNEELGSEYDFKIHEFANELGYTLKERLGSGENGVSYIDDNGYVFKLTINPDEFNTAEYLEDKELKYFANIYSTFISDDGDMMGIRKEYIEPLPNNLKENVKLFFDEFEHYYNDVIFEDVLRKGFDVKFNKFLNSKDLSDIYNQFVLMFKEADDEGILISDVSLENLGIRNDHLVLFDF